MTKNGCVWGNSQFTAEIWKRKLGVLAQPPRNGKANDSTKGNIIKVVGGGCSVGIEWGSLLVTTKYLHSSSYLPILLSMYRCTSPHTYYLLFCCALGRNSYFISCYILNTPILHFWISLDGRRTYYTNYTHYTAELYMYNTVLYRKISGRRHQYNTNSTVTTNHTRGPLRRSVSYRPNSYSDPTLLNMPSSGVRIFRPGVTLFRVFTSMIQDTCITSWNLLKLCNCNSMTLKCVLDFFRNVWARFCFMWDMVVPKPAFGAPNSNPIGFPGGWGSPKNYIHALLW